LQKTMSQYLEKGLLMFADPQANLQEYLQHMLKSDPSLNKIATDARHGIDAWSSILAKFLEESPADAVVEKKDNPPPSK
jgi:polyhydroxyalkanoate synthesis regulator protein